MTKSDQNTQQNAPFKIFFSGEHAPGPSNTAHGFPNPQKILAPTFPNPGNAPGSVVHYQHK